MLIIEAILEGAKTKTEIAKVIGKRETLVQNSLCEIYKKSSLQGVVYKTKLKRLDELIKFLEKYKENKNAR